MHRQCGVSAEAFRTLQVAGHSNLSSVPSSEGETERNRLRRFFFFIFMPHALFHIQLCADTKLDTWYVPEQNYFKIFYFFFMWSLLDISKL